MLSRWSKLTLGVELALLAWQQELSRAGKLAGCALQVLRKLRKLAWAENEAYLVRVMLKAVKGRFSQVPQVASLASGLARYHPSLGVAFVDALLEEVSKLVSSY